MRFIFSLTKPKLQFGAATALAMLVCALLLLSLFNGCHVSRSTPVSEQTPAYEAAVSQAIVDAVAIDDVTAWHATNDDAAVQGFGFRKRALERRTSFIVDRGVRDAGRAFLSSIVETKNADGKTVYQLQREGFEAIDPEKLKRWAAIALTVLQIVEPFVPPPYNLAVHAAVMLLKLYLAQDEPQPARMFGPPVRGALAWPRFPPWTSVASTSAGSWRTCSCSAPALAC